MFTIKETALERLEGRLADIQATLDAIAIDLEQLVARLSAVGEEPSTNGEPVATHAPVYTSRGELTFPEWVNRGGDAR
jgi:hypothetical protein